MVVCLVFMAIVSCEDIEVGTSVVLEFFVIVVVVVVFTSK